jgi:type IX secretion system PorP/SprF family membrane protein
MKKALLSTVFVAIIYSLAAQQDAQLSMNTFNRLAINPAYAGSNKAVCGTLFYRQQWAGFDGAPQTGLVSIDYGRVLGGGVGLTIDQDRIGFQKTLKAKVAYAYQKYLNLGTLGIGLDAGMIQQSISPSADSRGFVSPDGKQTDAAIPWGGTSVATYDIGLGLYYYTRKFYVGVSTTHLPDQFSNVAKAGTLNGSYNLAPARHYYVMAGYTFKPDPMWEITPSILTKSVLASTQVDANLLVRWNKKLFFGGSYRINDAVIAMAGLDMSFTPQLSGKFGYAYDVTLSNIKTYSSGSHEIMMGMCYKLVPEGKITRHQNVRFL